MGEPNAPCPYLLAPRYRATPWGGRRFETELGRKDLPPGPVGESFEVSDLEGWVSRVEGGEHEGRSLREVWGGPFPLLVKILDAREPLSVQVHPDGREGGPAKEEAWAALGAGAEVASGEVRPPFPAPGGWLPRLARRRLRPPGPDAALAPDLFLVPPGTVHAVLAGSLLFEVQNPVDQTWRLDDHGRPGLDGRPRPLHLEAARGLLARGAEPGGEVLEGGLLVRGRRLWLRAHPPPESVTETGLVAFFLAGGAVESSHGGRTHRLEVPPARTAVLPPGRRALLSRGWVLSAGVP